MAGGLPLRKSRHVSRPPALQGSRGTTCSCLPEMAMDPAPACVAAEHRRSSELRLPVPRGR
jgi:hypothetical protein